MQVARPARRSLVMLINIIISIMYFFFSGRPSDSYAAPVRLADATGRSTDPDGQDQSFVASPQALKYIAHFHVAGSIANIMPRGRHSMPDTRGMDHNT